MKRPGFFEGVLLAAVFGVAAAVLGSVLAPSVGLPAVLRLLVPALCLAYLLWLARQSAVRSGWLTALALWLVMAGIVASLSLPFLPYLAIHAGAIWLLRSLAFYRGALPALLDLALSAAALALTAWAARHSGSLFLATWSFFLVQAFFVAIPPALQRRARESRPAASCNDNFDRAERQAEAALRQLFAPAHRRIDS